MRKLQKSLAGFAIAGILTALSSNAIAVPRLNQITIAGDRGGQVIAYAIRAKEFVQDGKRVRFAGRCDSACTLYLSMPRSQTCVTPGASFGFHLPYGASARGNQMATKYMMRAYPKWVRNWISANGGLTHSIKTMRYAYAAKYLPSCGGNAAVNS